MISLNAQLSNVLDRLFFGFLLILASGCGGSDDAKVVDFSKTIEVQRPREESNEDHSLRVAVGAMVSPKETFANYHQLLAYLDSHIDRRLELIQRKTYSEINELLGKGEIDLAFICSGPYITGKEEYGFELLAAPQVEGSHFYHSYLIVKKDSSIYRLEDLRGRVFAFTDPESNTGKLVPTYWLALLGERPETFFDRTIYTYSHDNSIMAVARGLVDGATVHGLIWEYYQRTNPTLTSKIRVIKKSEPFGVPPLVCSRYLSTELREGILHLLLSMHRDQHGKRILNELMIERFIPPKDEWYDSIRRVNQHLALLAKRNHAVEKP